MTRLLFFAAAIVLSAHSFAEPHVGTPKVPVANSPGKPRRDRTQKPLFEQYPSTINCDDMEKAQKAVKELRDNRNEQLIASSSLLSVDAMKRILATTVDSMRQGEIRPERKESEAKTYLEKFGLNVEPTPSESTVIAKAAELLDSASYQEREIATRFLTAMGPRILKEQAVIQALKSDSPEQSMRMNGIAKKVLLPTSVRFYPENDSRLMEAAALRLTKNHDWAQLWKKTRAEGNTSRLGAFTFKTMLKLMDENKTEVSLKEAGNAAHTLHLNPMELMRKMEPVEGEIPVILCEDSKKRREANLQLAVFPPQLEIAITTSGEVTFRPYDQINRVYGFPVFQVQLDDEDFPVAPAPRSVVVARELVWPTVEDLRKHLAGLVSGELEAKSPAPLTANDLAWLAASKEVREKGGLDKTDGKTENSVAPLIQSLESEDFRVRYLARELLEFCGPSLAQHPAWIEKTKYSGEWSPTLRTQIETIQKAHAALQTAPGPKK